jgi:hypothetical protein
LIANAGPQRKFCSRSSGPMRAERDTPGMHVRAQIIAAWKAKFTDDRRVRGRRLGAWLARNRLHQRAPKPSEPYSIKCTIARKPVAGKDAAKRRTRASRVLEIRHRPVANSHQTPVEKLIERELDRLGGCLHSRPDWLRSKAFTSRQDSSFTPQSSCFLPSATTSHPRGPIRLSWKPPLPQMVSPARGRISVTNTTLFRSLAALVEAAVVSLWGLSRSGSMMMMTAPSCTPAMAC